MIIHICSKWHLAHPKKLQFIGSYNITESLYTAKIIHGLGVDYEIYGEDILYLIGRGFLGVGCFDFAEESSHRQGRLYC